MGRMKVFGAPWILAPRDIYVYMCICTCISSNSYAAAICGRGRGTIRHEVLGDDSNRKDNVTFTNWCGVDVQVLRTTWHIAQVYGMSSSAAIIGA